MGTPVRSWKTILAAWRARELGLATAVLAVGCSGCRVADKRVSLAVPSVSTPRDRVSATVDAAAQKVTAEKPVPDASATVADESRTKIRRTSGPDDRAVVTLADAAPPRETESLVEPLFPEEFPSLAAARVEQSGPAPMSLEELQQLALANNPTLRQAEGFVRQAQGNWLQSGLYPNPVLGYEGGANNAPFDGQSLFLSQNIVTGKKLGWSREVASRDTQRAQWEARAQIERVVNDIRIRRLAVLGAQQRLVVTREMLQFADDGVAVVEKLFREEQVTRADLLQARVQQSQMRILHRNAQSQWTAAWKQLTTSLGCPDLPLRPLAGEIEAEDDAPLHLDYEGAWSRICHTSPMLEAARSRAAAAAAQVRREQVEPIPDLQLSGRVGRDFASPQFMMYGLQIGMELPVFDRNQGNITAAAGEFAAAQAEIRRIELSLRDRLAVAFQKYDSARNEVETYRVTILPTAKDNVALTQRGYEEGELDFLRVLTARRDLSESTMNYVTSLIDLRTSAVEIDGMLLTGGLDPVESNPISSNGAGQTSGAGR